MNTSQKVSQVARKAARRVRNSWSRPEPNKGPGARGPEAPAPRTAILIVNGFDRRGRWGEYNEAEAREFPWIDLCLRQIDRYSADSSYEILAWDNSFIPEQRRLMRAHPKVRMFGQRQPGAHIGHGPALDRLLLKVRPGTEYVITMDTDSFPIRSGWIENLTGRLSSGAMLAGVWRSEIQKDKPAYVHPSGLAVRRDTLLRLGSNFAIGDGVDVGTNVTAAAEAVGGRLSRLLRTNHWNPHYLMGAVYGDLIYHQGAGSRNPRFTGGGQSADHEAVREALRNAAFSDIDGLIDALTGNADPGTVEGVRQSANP